MQAHLRLLVYESPVQFCELGVFIFHSEELGHGRPAFKLVTVDDSEEVLDWLSIIELELMALE